MFCNVSLQCSHNRTRLWILTYHLSDLWILHKGHVRTDMGGAAAPVTTGESVSGMRQVIAGAGMADNGQFFNYDGAALPW